MKRTIALLFLIALALPVGAREVFPLNEGWRFYFKSENSSDQARHITLPHSWNTDPQAEGSFLTTTGNYQNDLYIPAEWASRRLFVKFYGVQSVADLFVNGSHVGQHRGGATAFTFEITDKIRFGADNALTMVVSNSVRSDVLPTSTDINLYGGIYREAELIVTGSTAVSPLWLGTDGVLVRTERADAKGVAGEIELFVTTKRPGSALLGVEISGPDGRSVFSRQQRVRTEERGFVIPFSVDRPRLWSPADPALYTVTATVGDDTVRVRTGFRKIDVSETEGLCVNDVRMPVRGVVLYHDNARSGGTLTSDDYDADLNEILDLGATAVRSAVMPHAPYFYDRCDELGLLAWVDIPFHRAFLGDVAYFSTPQFEQNGLDQLQEIVAQNMNHPSVAMWGLFSHLWLRGDDVLPYLRRLNEAAHALDPSRPTVACSDQDGAINFVTDLIVWHQDVGWQKGKTDDVVLWRDKLQKNWSHLRSAICYGGSGVIGHKNYATRTPARKNWMPEERQTRFHEDYARNLESDSLFWGTWIANMFDYGSARRSYGRNNEGLVTLDRRERKDAYYLYRAMWNAGRPTLYIADRHRTLRDASPQVFRVYSSAGVPVMTIGQDTVALRENGACQYLSDSVKLGGRVEVKVRAGALRDSVKLISDNALVLRAKPAPRRTGGLSRTN